MAVTQDHGNPCWTCEETILALKLYFRCEGRVPLKNDEGVIELSKPSGSTPFMQNLQIILRFAAQMGTDQAHESKRRKYR